MDWKGRFLAGIFSESDGTPSASRVFTAVILAFELGWVTAILVTHISHHIEPILPDLGGLAAYVGALYGINKISGAFQSRNGGPPSQ